jgi:hypothetical protein
MKTTHFKIEKVHVDGMTGHLTVHARVVEREAGNETPGLLEVYGIDPAVLETAHEGDGEKWREWVEERMLRRHQARQKIYAGAQDWEGKEWPVENS